MSRLHHLKLLLRGYRLAAWRLVIYILMILLFPILIFMPKRIINNCDKIISDFLLKILWFIWRLIRALLLFTLVLVLFVLSPILWPIYLGIAFFWPGFVINLFSIKLF